MSETWNTTRVNWFPSSWNPFPVCAAIQNFTWAKLYAVSERLYSVWKGGKPLFGPSLFKEIWYGDHEYKKTAGIWWQNLKSEAAIQSLSNRRSGSCTCSHKSTRLSQKEPLPPLTHLWGYRVHWDKAPPLQILKSSGAYCIAFATGKKLKPTLDVPFRFR